MWICPDCGRKFSRNKQSHSCVQYSLDDLLIRKNPQMVALFNLLTDKIRSFGEIELHAGKFDITLRRYSTFLSVLIEKDHLTLFFISRKSIDEFPVYQTYHSSANRWVNAVKIEIPDEIDGQLMRWLREAWELAV